MLDLDAIKARLAAATPGPWTSHGWEVDGADDEPAGERLIVADAKTVVGLSYYDGDHITCSRVDADIIANAPTDIAALVAEVERLRKIFDDAGQGEHNVLALIDHYQDAAIAADERARSYLLADSRAMDAAQSVVDKARELLSYDWQCRLEDCEVGDSARNDARELEHAIAEWDRAMGCDE